MVWVMLSIVKMSKNIFFICFVIHIHYSYGSAIADTVGIENGNEQQFFLDNEKRLFVDQIAVSPLKGQTDNRNPGRYKRNSNMHKLIEMEDTLGTAVEDIQNMENKMATVKLQQQSLLKEFLKLNSNQQTTNAKLQGVSANLAEIETRQEAISANTVKDLWNLEDNMNKIESLQQSLVNELWKLNSNQQETNSKLQEMKTDFQEFKTSFMTNILNVIRQSLQTELNTIKGNQNIVDVNHKLTNSKLQVVSSDLEEIKTGQQSILRELDEMKRNQLELVSNQRVTNIALQEVNTTLGAIKPRIPTAMAKLYADGDCGGVLLVADRGIINYSFDPTLNATIRCVWTVRANKRSKVTFQLLKDELDDNGNSFITLSPYYNVYSTNTLQDVRLKYTEQILPGDDDEYTVDGPLVFVTFYFNPSEYTTSTRNSFQLQFVGTNTSILESTSFFHYHYNEDTGLITWPNVDGVYPPNATVTFVINPNPIPIYIELSYLRIQNSRDCSADSLIFLKESTAIAGFPYYTVHGPPNSNYRYCLDKSIVIKPSPESSRFITIFNSHEARKGNGFQFAWKRTSHDEF